MVPPGRGETGYGTATQSTTCSNVPDRSSQIALSFGTVYRIEYTVRTGSFVRLTVRGW